MSEFHDPVDPSKLPNRRCAECGGVMKAIDAGTEGRSPVARYACESCNHQVKITPLTDTGGWMAIALLAWATIAGILYITGKPYDAESVIWTGIILIGFMAPFLATYLKANKYPITDGHEPGASVGFAGNLFFVALVFGVVLTGAAATSLLL